MSGPPKTPTAILKARGSWRAKDRDGEPQAAPCDSVPLCPDHLKGPARKIWDETAAGLVSMRVLVPTDLHKLADYCSRRAEYLKLDEDVRRRLMSLSKSKFFPTVVAMRNQAFVSMCQAGAELGLSPAARTRVKAVPEQPKDAGKGRFFKGA